MLSFLNQIFSKKKETEKINFPFTINVSECIGNRYVIPDIHGCLDTFRALIASLNLTFNDQVFLLGDYIDRGKNSRGVIDEIINLKNSGYKIFALKGNHEDDLLSLYSVQSEKLILQYLEIEGANTLFNENLEIEEKYLEFLIKLPHFFELNDFLLVHAGFNFKKPDPFRNTDAMLWIRNFKYDSKMAKGKTIIHGHDFREISEIIENIEKKSKIIPLDNGCVFIEQDLGNLLCFNLNTYELIVQENIETI